MKSIKQIIEEKEYEIRKTFEQINQKGIDKEVKRFDIEIFINPFTEIDARLFSMDDSLNGVDYSENNKFAGSIELFNTINIRENEINVENVEEEEVIYNEILAIIKNIVNKYIDPIEIPVYIMHHDTTEWINVKTGEVKNFYEL